MIMEHYPTLGKIGLADFWDEVAKRFGNEITIEKYTSYPNSTFFYVLGSDEEVAIYTNETTYGIRKKETQ